MFPRNLFLTCIATLAAGLCGCASQKAVDHVPDRSSQRPPQLDRLDAFVGRWKIIGEATMAGLDRPVSFAGDSDVRWDGGRRYLVARGVTRMEGRDETHGLAGWTYDARSGKYRSVQVSSDGGVATGTSWHDDRTGTWHARLTSRGPSGKMTWKGQIRFIDENTKEERWTGYGFGGLIKTVVISKTEERL
jgi:hypothetical protein